MATYELNVKINGIEQSVQTIGELEQALKATNNELAQTEQSSQAFTQLQSQALKLEQELSNVTKDAQSLNTTLNGVDRTVDKLTNSIQDTAQASQQLGETTSINQLNQSITQANNSSQSLRTELRKITAELQTLEPGSQRFVELSTRAGELRDTIGDTSAVVGALAGNATERLGIALSGVANIGITGLQGVTGAMQLFGVESESARAVLEKLQGLLFLTQAIQGLGAIPDAITQIKAGFTSLTTAREADLVVEEAQINANTAQASTTAINTASQEANTGAVGDNTKSKGINAIATDGQAVATRGATLAQNAMNLAMKAAPWALAITGITLLITYWDDLTNSETAAEKATKDFNEEQKKLAEQIEQNTYKSIAQASIAYNELRGSIEDANDTATKQSWIKEALKDLPELSALTGEEADAAERVTEALRVRADLQEAEARRKGIIDQIATAEATIVEGLDKQRKAREGQIFLSNEQLEVIMAQGTAALSLINNLRKQLPAIEANLVAYRKQKKEIEDANKAIEDQRQKEKEAAEEAKRQAEERRRAYKSAYEKIKSDITSNLASLNQIEQGYIDDLARTSFKTKEEQVDFELKLEQRKLDEIIKFRNEDVQNSKVLGKEKQKLLAQLDLETQQAQDALNNLYAEKRRVAAAEDLKVVQDRAAQILLINQILQQEVAFGDQDATDAFEQLELRKQQLTQQSVDFEASMNKMSFDEYKKYLTDRQKALEKINTAQKSIDLKTAQEEGKKQIDNLADLLEKEGILTKDFDKRKVVELKTFTTVQAQEALNALNAKTEAFTAEEEAYKILLTAKLNQDELYNVKALEIEQQYSEASTTLNRETIDKQNEYRLQKFQEYFAAANDALSFFADSQAAGFSAIIGGALTSIQEGFDLLNQDFETLTDKIAAYAAVIGSVINSILSGFVAQNQANLDAELERLNIATNAEKDRITDTYNASIEAEKAKYEQNLITQQQYNSAVETLNNQLSKDLEDQDKALTKVQTEEKKKAFKQEQNLKVAQAVIAGLQGAVQAFAGAMQLGPIAGPIVGGILAAAVAGLAAGNIAQIKKVKFDAGQTITPADTTIPSTGGQVTAPSLSSTGGFTTFNENALGGGQQTGTTTTPIGGGMQKVYVLESDISAVQQRVRVLENNSTFG